MNFATLEPRTVSTKTIPTTPGAEIGKEGGNAGSNQAPPIAPQERPELQQKGKETKALQAESYGEPRGEPPQRSPSLFAQLDDTSKPRGCETGGASRSHTHQVPPKGNSSHPRKSEFNSVPVGNGRSSEGPDIAAARQAERIDLSAARAKAPKVRNSLRKNSTSSVNAPFPQSLIAQPGSGTGADPPEGETAQGPSPIDYGLEIKADFPTYLVVEMQESAAKKARRTVIGRTLGGRATFKALLDCLKLHLPAPFSSVSPLTRGYFEVLFESEEGAKATRRLAAVEWSGLGLSFSRYIPNFDSNSHGAEAQLTHAVKVQFPDLHEQFRNTRAMTIMVSKIGEVLEIESANSYIKRPAGPMITVELKDISKLPGYIRIPSMAEGAGPNDTVAQKILYAELPNQCRKCRRFGHHAHACTTNIRKPWEGGAARPSSKTRNAEGKEPGREEIPHPSQAQIGKLSPKHKGLKNGGHHRTISQQNEANKAPEHPAQRIAESTSTTPPNTETATPRNRPPKTTSGTPKIDQEMEEASTLLAQLESTTKTGEELQEEGRQRLEEGRKRMETIQISTLIFGIRGSVSQPHFGQVWG